MTGGGPEGAPSQHASAVPGHSSRATGNPNHSGLPEWPAFDAAKRSTMIFNNACVAKDDPMVKLKASGCSMKVVVGECDRRLSCRVL